MPQQPLPADFQDADIYTHLDDVDLEAVSAANVPEALIPLEIRRGTKDQPLALRTKFGWTLFGASSGGEGMNQYAFNVLHTSEDDDKMNTMLERFWKS